MRSSHPRIRMTTLSLEFGTGPERVERIRARLNHERQVCRTFPEGSHNQSVAAFNIAVLERLLGDAQRNQQRDERHGHIGRDIGVEVR